MTYDAELRLLTDVFKHKGVSVTIADLNLPPSKMLISSIYLQIVNQQRNRAPLREYLPMLKHQTVYKLEDHLSCCYIYFILPDLQPEALLVIGPFLPQPLPEKKLLELAEQQTLEPKYYRQLQRYFSSVPILDPASDLYLFLDMFYQRIWGVGGYSVEYAEKSEAADSIGLRQGQMISEEENVLMNAAIMENRYAYENDLIDAVRKGQQWRIERFMSKVHSNSFEQRVTDPVRNVKNYCIITNTLLRKAAEQGGVHPVYIDELSTSFALRIEQLASTADGQDMIREMAIAYCRLVRTQAIHTYSTPIQKAVLLIDGDLSGDLTLSALASKLSINSSYLSTLFKKETGETVSQYVTKRRIRLARHLLKTTRLQIQTVSQYCGFEDVHYFTRVFHRTVGMTPREYRQSKQK